MSACIALCRQVCDSLVALSSLALMYVLKMEAYETVLPGCCGNLEMNATQPGRTALHVSVLRRHIGAEPGRAAAETAHLLTQSKHMHLSAAACNGAPTPFLKRRESQGLTSWLRDPRGTIKCRVQPKCRQHNQDGD